MSLTKGFIKNCYQGGSMETPIVQVIEIAKKTDSFLLYVIKFLFTLNLLT